MSILYIYIYIANTNFNLLIIKIYYVTEHIITKTHIVRPHASP